MGTLENIKANFSTVRNLISDGGERYVRAAKAVFTVEQAYRTFRRRSANTSDKAFKLELLQHAHNEGAAALRSLCEENGATWVKFAQFMSCRPDLMPNEYIVALQSLQDQARSVSFESIRPTLIDAWGEHWDQSFAHFDIVPAATASVAQVYKATLHSGDTVAVKVRLPDVVELFEQDSMVFNALAGILSPLVKEVDIKQVTQQLIQMTLAELNFEQEAKNLQSFGQHQHLPGIRIPKLIEAMSSERIIVTEWVEGTSLGEFLQRRPDAARPVLSTLMQDYLFQALHNGIYHADPHPGNFIVDQEGKVCILDFGALGYLEASEGVNYSALLSALVNLNADDYTELFERAGFSCENSAIFNQVVEYFQEEDVSDDFVEQLSQLIHQLKKRRVTIPDSFIGMARVLLAAGGLMQQHDVSFNWPGT